MLTKRTNILFDETLWRRLTKLAAAKQMSVSNLIRDAVEEKYAEEAQLEEIRQAIHDIRRIRPRFKGKIDYKALINYGRKY